jgi:hypothetical protein
MILSRETPFALQEKHRFSPRILEIVTRLREILRTNIYSPNRKHFD